MPMMNYNGKFKIICLMHNHVRSFIIDGVVSIQYVESKENLAYPLSKGLRKELVSSTTKGVGLKCL